MACMVGVGVAGNQSIVDVGFRVCVGVLEGCGSSSVSGITQPVFISKKNIGRMPKRKRAMGREFFGLLIMRS